MQNIGAYGVEVSQTIHAVHVWNLQAQRFEVLSNADCQFAYRDSVFKHQLRDRAVILDVTFALPKRWEPNLRYAELATEIASSGTASPTARDISDAVIAIRTRKLPDPAKIGNAGSFFKNPVVTADKRDALLAQHPALVSYPQADGSYKLAAGWLIDQCGWKGRSLGAAGVHEKQALVLVNRGGRENPCTGGEVMTLAKAIQTSVYERFGIRLEPEPVVI